MCTFADPAGRQAHCRLLWPAGKLKQECTIVVVSHDLHELSQQVRAACSRPLLGSAHLLLLLHWLALTLGSTISSGPVCPCRWTLPGRCYREAGCSTDRTGVMSCER